MIDRGAGQDAPSTCRTAWASLSTRWLCAAAAVLLAAAPGCRREAPPAGVQPPRPERAVTYPRTLQDQSGAEVVLRAKPARIVSTAPSNTEILFALGLGDRVVGVTSQCDYPPEAQQKEKVGDFRISLEKVASLRPDLVVSVAQLQPDLIEKLRDTGLPVLALDPYSWPDLYDAIRLIGDATEASGTAAEVIARLKARRARVVEATSHLPEADRPKVFVEISDEPLMTAGPHAFITQIVTDAGGRSIAYDARLDWAIFNPEVVVARNPDVIITTIAGSADATKKRQGWNIIEAVKKDRVYEVDPDIVTRPGPRLAEGLETVLGMLHPDIARRLREEAATAESS